MYHELCRRLNWKFVLLSKSKIKYFGSSVTSEMKIKTEDDSGQVQCVYKETFVLKKIKAYGRKRTYGGVLRFMGVRQNIEEAIGFCIGREHLKTSCVLQIRRNLEE